MFSLSVGFSYNGDFSFMIENFGWAAPAP